MSEQADLELRLDWPYDEALAWMSERCEHVVAGGRMAIAVGSHREPVVTLGRHAPATDILDEAALVRRGVLLRRIDRGGGATAHVPGQLVCYPVVALRRLGISVRRMSRLLEESALSLLEECFGIAAATRDDEPGVYVGQAKIASVGFRVSRGVVTHGLALNLDNDLGVFDLIATCGQRARPMTSVKLLTDEARIRLIDRRAVALALARRVASRCVLELPA